MESHKLTKFSGCVRHSCSPTQQYWSYLKIHLPIVKSKREYNASIALVFPTSEYLSEWVVCYITGTMQLKIT